MSMTQINTQNNGRTYGGLSLEERKAQRRETFLRAGLEVFGTIGFRAATVRCLCKEAKLTDRYFYESYGSLEKLLMAVYEHCMTNLSKKILQSMTLNFRDNNVANALEAGLDAYFSELEDPRIARICMVELEAISPEVDQLYNNYIRSFSTILLGLANKVYPHWSLDQEQREVIGISLVGAMRQSATNWLMTDYTTDRKTLIAGTHKLFMGIIELIDSRQSNANP